MKPKTEIVLSGELIDNATPEERRALACQAAGQLGVDYIIRTLYLPEEEPDCDNLSIGLELAEEGAAQSIDVYEFNNRALKRFRGVGIETMGELCRLTPSELRQIPGFGRKTLEHVHDVLDASGIARVSKYPLNQQAQYS